MSGKNNGESKFPTAGAWMHNPGEPVLRKRFMISNETGLHALAATRFAQKAASYDAEVQVEKDGQRVDGKNIISMLMLLADKGTTITISSRGDDAPEAMQALGSLIESRFDQD